MAGKASLVGVVGLAMALATTPWAGASTPGRSTPAATPGHHGGPGHQAKPVADPASLVNPLIGTGSGGKVVGDVDTFPGADYPFGMLQWSPDTSPTRTDGGGYYYPDNHILGFSLTHISGPGCQVYGDVPILPTVGSIGTTPGSTTEPFTHAHEHASAGYYSVDLGQPAVKSQLTVTPRTGIGQFTFPATQHANFLVKAGDSANGSSAATAQIVGNDEVVGSVTSGHFCNAHHTYTVHYVLKFNRPFTSHGTWNGSSVTPGADQASGSKSGAWVTFDTTSNPVVLSKVAISFVSQANAQQNLQAEQPGWSFQGVLTKAKSAWNRLLSRIQVAGGTHGQQETFYTALYHSLLHPNIFSDVNGQYVGFDGKIHTAAPGHASYANFSGWDIYRSDVQLASLVAPKTMSDVVRTMLADYAQTGMLPKWTLAHGETYVMVGDPADPIIADAYAFGARDFNTKAALSAMVAEATKPNNIRPGLNYLEKLGYLPADGTYKCCNFYGPVSTTLEYNSADFAIGAFARALGNTKVAQQFVTRAQDWENVFNPKSGFMQPRKTDGQFVTPFDPTSQSGFVEGNAYQYTRMVPFNLAGLIGAQGGDKTFVKRLDHYFTQLNAGPATPYDWAGNEPNLAAPWEYDYAGAPYRTQAVVRRIMTTLYGPRPGGEPGNDDLGAMSSWYVWAALGMYPEVPGSSTLVLGSPLFPEATITVPGSHKPFTIRAPKASAGTPYVHSLRINHGRGVGGRHYTKTWIPLALVRSGGTLNYALGATPDTNWGSAPGDAPPSATTGEAPVIPYLSSRQVTVAPGGSTTVTLAAQNVTGSPVTVSAKASAPSGVTVSPSSASLTVAPDGKGQVTLTVAAGATTPQTFYGVPIALSSRGSGAKSLPTLHLTVLVAQPGSILRSMDNRGISSDAAQSAANFDGSGYSYSAKALASAHLVAGQSVTANGVTFTWPSSPPGYPDNVVAGGQTIPVRAPAGSAQLAFLGSATNGPSSGEVTLTYKDGSTTHFLLGLSDWTLNANRSSPSFGNTEAAATSYRNCGCGTSQTVKTYIFETAVPVDPTKVLVSVTLPTVANQGHLHVFSIVASTKALSAPVVTSLSPWTAGAGQTVTIRGSGLGATQGSGYVAFSDTGTNWGSPGNLATFRVDSWSDSAITFTVPTPSGTSGQWHVTPGTPASVRVTTSTGSTSDAAVLEIAASANQAAYYDNAGISPDTNQACANYDGDGYSYSAQALVSAGLSPGATVKADGATLTWPKAAPCSADNILAAGQTVLLPGKSGAAKLVLLGSSSNGSSSGTVTIHYTDGSTSTGTVSFNDWAGGPSGADTAIATMPYRNTTGGRSQPITMYVYATSVPVSSAKTVASVTLPDVAGHVGSRTTAMHVFALGLGG